MKASDKLFIWSIVIFVFLAYAVYLGGGIDNLEDLNNSLMGKFYLASIGYSVLYLFFIYPTIKIVEGIDNLYDKKNEKRK